MLRIVTVHANSSNELLLYIMILVEIYMVMLILKITYLDMVGRKITYNLPNIT